MKHNVLDSVLEGTDEPAFYNNYVGVNTIDQYKDTNLLKNRRSNT